MVGSTHHDRLQAKHGGRGHGLAVRRGLCFGRTADAATGGLRSVAGTSTRVYDEQHGANPRGFSQVAAAQNRRLSSCAIEPPVHGRPR